MRFRKFAAEFRGITDDRKLAPYSPGFEGAFLAGFRNAACFVMAAGLLMCVITLALQPLLKANATITDALEKVYAFERRCIWWTMTRNCTRVWKNTACAAIPWKCCP